MGVAFMLAHPYGFTRVMSSFRWPRYFVNGKVSVGVVQHTFFSRKGGQLCSKFNWCCYIYYLFINSLRVSGPRPLFSNGMDIKTLKFMVSVVKWYASYFWNMRNIPPFFPQTLEQKNTVSITGTSYKCLLLPGWYVDYKWTCVKNLK